jgi:FtsH-binding integral membrane protein
MSNTYRTSSFSKVNSTDFDAGLRSYMQRIYSLMSLALFVTAAVAFFTSQSAELMKFIHFTGFRWIVMFAPLVFVFIFAAKINSLSASAAKNCLWAFSALMGLSLSYILLAYTGLSVVRVFLITACMFGSTSLYGYVTKKDLTSFGSFLMMGLFGLIIASIINIFMQSSALHFAISILGVIIFTGLAAYDTQKAKNMYYQVASSDAASIQKTAIMCALSLYMDFINLFIMLLRLIGERR